MRFELSFKYHFSNYFFNKIDNQTFDTMNDAQIKELYNSNFIKVEQYTYYTFIS